MATKKDSIRTFLIHEFGMEKGRELYEHQQMKLLYLIRSSEHYTKSQQKTLSKTILPRIAMFQILSEEMENAEALLEAYMCYTVAPTMREKFKKIDKMPYGYAIFSRVFPLLMKRSDLWEAKISLKTKDELGIDIYRCLWHDACVENDCPQICKHFCKCDDIMYSDLSSFGFQRTQTLGLNGSKCDFIFFRK